jgi:hypothetical protein
MGITVYTTVCSREKDESPQPLLAISRYKGSHIRKIEKDACATGYKFFILSGKHGLLAPEEPVDYYDYLLTVENVDKLVIRLVEQLWQKEISSVHFYCKPGPRWFPYFAAMVIATSRAGVQFTNHIIAPDF